MAGRSRSHLGLLICSGDELSAFRHVDKSFKPAIIYVTLTQPNFISIKSSVQSTVTLDATLIDDPKVKVYKYSNANNVIEMVEPFQPQRAICLCTCLSCTIKRITIMALG